MRDQVFNHIEKLTDCQKEQIVDIRMSIFEKSYNIHMNYGYVIFVNACGDVEHRVGFFPSAFEAKIYTESLNKLYSILLNSGSILGYETDTGNCYWIL